MTETETALRALNLATIVGLRRAVGKATLSISRVDRSVAGNITAEMAGRFMFDCLSFAENVTRNNPHFYHGGVDMVAHSCEAGR